MNNEELIKQQEDLLGTLASKISDTKEQIALFEGEKSQIEKKFEALKDLFNKLNDEIKNLTTEKVLLTIDVEKKQQELANITKTVQDQKVKSNELEVAHLQSDNFLKEKKEALTKLIETYDSKITELKQREEGILTSEKSLNDYYNLVKNLEGTLNRRLSELDNIIK